MLIRLLAIIHHLLGALFGWYLLGGVAQITAHHPKDAFVGFYFFLIPLLITSALLLAAALHQLLAWKEWRPALRLVIVMASPYLCCLPLVLLLFVKPKESGS